MKPKRPQDFKNISRSTNSILHFILFTVCIFMILPLVFVFIISLTSQSSISTNGYSFIPNEWSLSAYEFIFKNAGNILNAFFISIVVTVVGTILSTYIISSYAYAISRKTFRYRKIFSIIALIPMLLASGLVANYLVMTRVLHLKNSIWALILPLAVNSFFIFILRSFYKGFVPDSLVESAKIDGANDIGIFFRIVLPISKPGIATIALFQTLAYWNDWFNAMLYIDDAKKTPIQYMLIKTENTNAFLQQMGSQIGMAISEISKVVPTDTLRMAVVVLIVIPIALSYPYFQRFFVKGLTIGAVKE